MALVRLLADPAANVDWNSPVEHVVITTNAALLAIAAAVLAARAALQLGQYRALLVALGLGGVGGIFAVHGLATPGVLFRGAREADAFAVVALSAQLSLFVPAILFGTRYSPLADRLARVLPPRALVGTVVGGTLVYAVVALLAPSAIGALMGAILPAGIGGSGGYAGGATRDGLSGTSLLLLGPGVIAIGLFGFAAWRQGREYRRSRLPFHGALVAAYLLFAQTQVAMTVGQLWSLAWWEYHGLMLAAVAVALVALFIELDRRRGLERFLPPNVVERVLQGDALRLTGDRRLVTVLFADLRGSTALADVTPPEAVIEVINAYVRAMARAVLDRGGIVDKFTGDGLMAIFGAMDDRGAGVPAAAAAALDLRAALGALSQARTARGEPALAFGVGIHCGPVVLGAVGLPERSDYTAIGDTVNTASRMESLCRELGVDIVLSADAAAALRHAGAGSSLVPLGEASVKGKSAPIAIFSM